MMRNKDVTIKAELNPSTKDLQLRHKKALQQLKGNKTAFKEISILLDRWVQTNFKTQGGNVGKWQKFALRKDGRRGRWIKGKGLDESAKLLQDTGRLRASFRPFASIGNAGIGSDVKYAEAHEKGEGHLPLRRMLPIRREIHAQTRKIIARHIKDSFKEAYGGLAKGLDSFKT